MAISAAVQLGVGIEASEQVITRVAQAGDAIASARAPYAVDDFELIRVGGTSITVGRLAIFQEALQGPSTSLVRALRDAFGSGVLFGGLCHVDGDHLTIAPEVGDTTKKVSLPLDAAAIGETLGNFQRARIVQSTRTSERIRAVLEASERHADDCIFKAQLQVPPEWRHIKGEALDILERVSAFGHHKGIPYRTMMALDGMAGSLELLQVTLGDAQRLPDLVEGLGAALKGHCQAKWHGARALDESLARPSVSQLVRLDAIEDKAQMLLGSAFDGSFLGPSLKACREALCTDGCVSAGAYVMWRDGLLLALLAACAASFFLADCLAVLGNGVLYLFPCLQTIKRSLDAIASKAGQSPDLSAGKRRLGEIVRAEHGDAKKVTAKAVKKVETAAKEAEKAVRKVKKAAKVAEAVAKEAEKAGTEAKVEAKDKDRAEASKERQEGLVESQRRVARTVNSRGVSDMQAPPRKESRWQPSAVQTSLDHSERGHAQRGHAQRDFAQKDRAQRDRAQRGRASSCHASEPPCAHDGSTDQTKCDADRRHRSDAALGGARCASHAPVLSDKRPKDATAGAPRSLHRPLWDDDPIVREYLVDAGFWRERSSGAGRRASLSSSSSGEEDVRLFASICDEGLFRETVQGRAPARGCAEAPSDGEEEWPPPPGGGMIEDGSVAREGMQVCSSAILSAGPCAE